MSTKVLTIIEVQLCVCLEAVKQIMSMEVLAKMEPQWCLCTDVEFSFSQDKRSRRQAESEGDENERGGGEKHKKVS